MVIKHTSYSNKNAVDKKETQSKTKQKPPLNCFTESEGTLTVNNIVDKRGTGNKNKSLH